MLTAAIALAVLPAGNLRVEAQQSAAQGTLKKCSDVYASLHSYYEESRITVRMGEGAEQWAAKGRAVVWFSRGSELRVGIESTKTLALVHDGAAMTVYTGSKKNAETVSDVPLEEVADFVGSKGWPLFTLGAYVAEKPYEVLMDGVGRILGPDTVDYAGEEALMVRLISRDGAETRCYIDPKDYTFKACVYKGSLQQNGRKIPLEISIAVMKAMTDEAPPAGTLSSHGIPGLAGEDDPAGTPDSAFPPVPLDTARFPGLAALMWKPAPDFELPDLEGASVVLADQRGRVVLLDFWAIFCPPCRTALPELIALAKDHAEDPFEYYAISTSDTAEEIEEFKVANKLDIPALVGRGARAQSDYGVEAIPTLLVLDKEGFVRFIDVGWRGRGQLGKAVEFLLAEEYPPE